MLKAPWIRRHVEDAGRLRDPRLAAASLLANLYPLELFELRARARYLASDTAPTPEGLSTATRLLAGDAEHLMLLADAAKSWGDEAWVSGELAYALEAALRERDPLLLELAHVVVVEPSLAAVARTLAEAADSPMASLARRLAREEERHYREGIGALSVRLSADADCGERFAGFLEANTVLLFASAFPGDEAKLMLATLMGAGGGEPAGRLKPLYAEVDRRRLEAAEEAFGPSSPLISVIRDYGLSKSGLC